MNIIANDVECTAEELKEAISAIPKSKFDAVPFEGSWTAGQVTEHLVRSYTGLPDILNGNVAPADRDPEALVPVLREIFLNFDTRLKSPKSVLPLETVHNSESMSAELATIFAGVAAVANTEDLDMICKDFEFPTLGELTRVELINFVIFHTQRHIHQLKNIAKHLEK